MISAKEVIEQVKDGYYPSEWRVFPGQYTDVDGIGLTVVAVGLILGAIFITLALLANYSGLSSFLWSIVIILSFGGTSLWIVRYLTRREPASSKQPLLIILPDGIVQFQPEDYRQYYCLKFPTINRIDLGQQTRINGVDGDISTTYFYWLDVFCSDGTYIRWGLNPAFGDTMFIGNTIIAAYRHYWRI